MKFSFYTFNNIEFFKYIYNNEVEITFSTRNGGVSKGRFASLNLGYKTDDNLSDVIINNAIYFAGLDYSPMSVQTINIEHKSNLVTLPAKDIFPRGDGMFTNLNELILAMYFADCLPIFIFDPVKKVIGLVHGGWRNIQDRIAKKAVNYLKHYFSSSPRELLVALGPAIGPCCFSLKGEVAKKFQKELEEFCQYIYIEGDRVKADLRKITQVQLLKEGVKEENIFHLPLCTFCNSDLFYSYRRDRGVTGRMLATIRFIK